MRVDLLFAALIVVVAVTGVKSFGEDAADRAPSDERYADNASTENVALDAYYTTSAREVRIPRGHHDQFFLTASINRSPAEFLVDTGASYVALRESDALNAGIYTKYTDYTHPVRTANGETKAALVTLRAINVGDLSVENVQAFILPDDQLSMNLLGMSFLSRLRSVEARGGELVLKG
ncbi:MAG: TIGR02281 family clan AA aspartic protease [Pseudomonadota bacterium]